LPFVKLLSAASGKRGGHVALNFQDHALEEE
jgi:hypothetical protein